MKKLLALTLFILPLSLFAQYQVILNSGDTTEVKKATLEGDYYTLEKLDGRKSKVPKNLVRTVISNAQPLEYEQVFQVDSNITKGELFNRARSWFVDYYKDASEVLQVSDKESGELIGAAVYKYSFMVGGVRIAMTIDYRVSVKMKGGRYKVSIYNLYNSKSSNNGSTPYDGIGEITEKHKENKRWLNPKRYDEMTMSIQVYVQVIYQSLFAAMSKPIEKEEDW
ncbi:MAG: DUF4468 domain-containing protein [Flavobacteriales bacterium]|nr:DUF4468 domain-containing protein [Flavobacteriales bacterium]